MKRQLRITLGIAGALTAAALYPCFASAQIATPRVSMVEGRSAAVPFELFRDSRIVLNGRINGIDTPMMLDSGAGVTTIDRDFARQIGLKEGMKISAQGAGGRQEAELVQDVTVEAGNLKLSGVTVAVIDLDAIEKAVGRPIPVVIGRELFMNSVVGIDFDQRLLTLSDPGTFTAPEGATEVKLTRDGTLHNLPITIDGLPPVQAVLDLGNGGALSLSKEYHESLAHFSKLPYAIGLSGGVGGVHEMKRVTVAKVELGGFAFSDVPTDLGSLPKGPYSGGANAGIQLFRPFQLTLDLGRDRMWLKRTGRPAEFPKDRAGIFAMLEGDHLSVLHVSPGSPAAKAGLKKGDRLVAIDGVRVGPGFYSSARGNWARGAAGTEVNVTRAEGGTVKITLADYY